jgi:hypothetical protein
VRFLWFVGSFGKENNVRSVVVDQQIVFAEKIFDCDSILLTWYSKPHSVSLAGAIPVGRFNSNVLIMSIHTL